VREGAFQALLGDQKVPTEVKAVEDPTRKVNKESLELGRCRDLVPVNDVAQARHSSLLGQFSFGEGR
jgi:hypothetical protein